MNKRNLLVVAVALVSLVGTTLLYAAKNDEKAALEQQLQELLKARVESAEKALEAGEASYQSGTVTVSDMLHLTRNLVDAKLAVATTPEEKVAALKMYVDHTAQVEEGVKKLFETASRGGEATTYYTAKVQHQTAEIELLKAELAAAN